MQCPTLGQNIGSDSRVLSLHLCDQVSYIHQHGPEEEQTILLPGRQRDLQNQTAIFVLQGQICNTVRRNLLLFMCCNAQTEMIKPILFI